jgi:hypothetical protein
MVVTIFAHAAVRGTRHKLISLNFHGRERADRLGFAVQMKVGGSPGPD